MPPESQPHETPLPEDRGRTVFAGMFLIVLAFAAYLPALDGEFLWDDDFYVEQNSLVHSPSGISDIWLHPRQSPQYYPLVFTTFWIEYRLWELDTFGYHAFNVLLHAMSAILLWRILRLLELPGAWLAAALFVVHPVHVESVAWITERKNTLSGFFYLASALCWLTGQADRGNAGSFRRPLYLLALGCFLCALWSKTVTATLPAALLLVTWWKSGTLTKREVISVLPMFVLAIPMGLLTAWLERVHVGAIGAEFDLSMTERVLVAGRVPWFYLQKLLYPVNLAFIYPRWVIDSGDWRQYLYPVAATLLVAVLIAIRNSSGRGPLTAILFFGGTLVPVSGFFSVFPMKYSFVADHFQYLASIGILTLIASVIASICERRDRIQVKLLLSSILLCILGLLTVKRCYAFTNLEALWRDTLRKNESSVMVHSNLGSILEDEGRLDEAYAHYQAAVEIAPDEALPMANLGALLYRVGRNDEAIEYLQRAVAVDPDYAPAHMNLGALLTDTGDPAEALHHLQLAVQLDPENPTAHYNLGRAHHRFGRPDEARRCFDAAVHLLGPSAADLPQLIPREYRTNE